MQKDAFLWLRRKINETICEMENFILVHSIALDPK
jgi:hypothetical protein